MAYTGGLSLGYYEKNSTMKGIISIGSNYVHLVKEINEWSKRGAKNFLLFEPVTETYYKMLDCIFYDIPARFHIDSRNIALGNMTGKVMMNIEKNNNGQSSSILKPKLHLMQYPWVKFTDTEEVYINKLDNVDYDRELYDAIHIDVQGMELEVLRGAVESLKFINEIECEVNTEELYEGCPMMDEIDEFLFFQGFKKISVDLIGKNWGDAVYTRF
jgi:FkbM family methyltransferase